MMRWLLMLLLLSLGLWLLRLLWLHSEQYYLWLKLRRQALSPEQINQRLQHWRTRRGRQLMLYLIGLPLTIFLLLVFVGEFVR